jgi:hypothetical protein
MPSTLLDRLRLVELGLLRDVADVALRRHAPRGELLTVHVHLTRVALEQAADHRDARGLPGPVGAQQTVRLALRDAEPGIVDGLHVPETLRQAPAAEDVPLAVVAVTVSHVVLRAPRAAVCHIASHAASHPSSHAVSPIGRTPNGKLTDCEDGGKGVVRCLSPGDLAFVRPTVSARRGALVGVAEHERRPLAERGTQLERSSHRLGETA